MYFETWILYVSEALARSRIIYTLHVLSVGTLWGLVPQYQKAGYAILPETTPQNTPKVGTHMRPPYAFGGGKGIYVNYVPVADPGGSATGARPPKTSLILIA